MLTIHTPAIRSASRWIVPGVLCIVLAGSGFAAAQVSFARLVVFGTSLSDPGNAFAFVRQAGTPPDYAMGPFLVPTLPYARGGHHLTNGATWIEQFARPLGLAADVAPAFRGESARAANYAVATARAYQSGITPDLPLQVGAFLLDTGGVAPPDALYVIEMGSNDVRDALAAAVSGGDSTAIIEAALTSIATHIALLYGSGARTFLVWNVPDPGLSPAVRALDEILPVDVRLLARSLALAFNQGLEARLAQLTALLPGLQIVPFDAYATLNTLVAAPGAFGLRVVDAACITPNVPPFACRNPREYLFWDGIHPTTAAHGLVAEAAAASLAW